MPQIASLSWIFADERGLAVGASGWAGVTLLTAILSWLMFKHLPEKDRQVRELIESKDQQVAAITRAFEQRIHDITALHRENLILILQHSDAQLTRTLDAIGGQRSREEKKT